MKAMILAAGFGTRLKPLTDHLPKALIPVDKKTQLELTINRLKQFGFNEFVINVHHHADKIIHFLKTHYFQDCIIEISEEKVLLDTGGGLKKARWFFDDGQPFLLHNVDVITDLNYRELMNEHHSGNALVTLAVRKRKTSRYFLFDENDYLCGWKSEISGGTKIMCPDVNSDRLRKESFMGIHIISPSFFDHVSETGVFSIVDVYLRLAAQGFSIKAFHADNYRWLDLGKKEQLDLARREFSDLI